MSEGRHDTSGHKNLKSAHDYRNSLQYLRYEFRFTIVMGKLIEQIDVIAQFKHDGEIIPMRLQILNSAGQPVAYTINGYRRIANKGTYTSVDNVFVTHIYKDLKM